MKFTLIPSSVAGSGPVHHQYLSSCLLDDAIALDAGCVGFYRSAQDQATVRHVLLSHTHQDHLASLPIFVENAYEAKADPVHLYGSADVLDCCQRDVFNDRIWPDFIALSRNNDRPFLKMVPFDAGQTLELEGIKITAVALNHVVPTVGYLLSNGQSSVAYVTDTGPTDEVWRLANERSDLKAVFLEATFPTNMAWLADVSKHLTPATFAAELRKLNRQVRVIVIHIKARFQTEVISEIQALNLPNIEIGQFGVPYVF